MNQTQVHCPERWPSCQTRMTQRTESDCRAQARWRRGSSGQALNTRPTCICQNTLSPDHSLQRWKNWSPGRRGLPLGPTASQWQPGTQSWLPLAFPALTADWPPHSPPLLLWNQGQLSAPGGEAGEVKDG